MRHHLLTALTALVVLPGCATGPLVGPALEMQATRAALQASLDSEGEVEPARGDVLDLARSAAAEQSGNSLPLAGADPDRDELEPPKDDDTPDERQAAADAVASRKADESPELVRTLEQLTREMSEQRMLMMMQLIAGRSEAPVAVDSSGRLVDLSVSVQRLQDEQQEQRESTAVILAELQRMSALVDERVPADTSDRLDLLQESMQAVPPALDALQETQGTLIERIEALEALHRNDALQFPTIEDDSPGDIDDTRGQAIPLLYRDEPTQDESIEDEPTEDEPTEDDVVEVDEAPDEQPAVDSEDESEEPVEDVDIDTADTSQARSEQRIAERAARVERRGTRQQQRQARRVARDDRAAAADEREAALAARYSDDPPADNSVAVDPVLVAAPARQRRDDDCVDTRPGPDGIRFGLDMRATRRLARLLEREVELVEPPGVVPLPPIVVCDDEDDDA